VIAACGQFYTERGPSPCVACAGGRRPDCRCVGCVSGSHRVASPLNATYSEGRERNRRQHNSDLFRRSSRREWI
jgi:hypothetical protein